VDQWRAQEVGSILVFVVCVGASYLIATAWAGNLLFYSRHLHFCSLPRSLKTFWKKVAAACMVLLTPIVTVCSVALLAIVYNYVEKGRLKPLGPLVLAVNGDEHQVAVDMRNDSHMKAWIIEFCDREGKCEPIVFARVAV
jgi:hypothetical protein